MPKFTLIAEWNYDDCDDNIKVTHEFNKEYLPDVIEQFETFLKGCSYHFNGNLELVTEDDHLNYEYKESLDLFKDE